MIIQVADTNYALYAERVKMYNGSIYKGNNPKACVITFGCQQNEADSERIKGIVTDMGYSLSSSYSECDLIIVNTCAIRAHAEDKALSLVGNFKALKKKNPDLIVGICGCMCAEAQTAKKIKNDFHFVTFTLEPNSIHLIPELVFKGLEEKKRSYIIGVDKGDIVEGLPAVRKDRHRAWVSIMYGCNNFCAYCIVPYVRGRERSRSSSVIISECRELVKCGVKEITLLGQNVNSYKSDLDFAGLIESIALIEGDFIIRFMTSHPKDVSERLISVLGKYNGKIAPYFHLPLQSGSNSILKLMGRTYTREGFLTTVEKLRKAVPDIALSTDVIVGFPTETERDFEDTLEVLKIAKFDMGYSFIYSLREGTAASKMDGQIPEAVKKERMNKLLVLQDEIALEKNLPYLNKTVRVLVDSVSEKDGKTVYNGRTDTNKLVHFTSDSTLNFDFYNVKIIKVAAYDLIGVAD